MRVQSPGLGLQLPPLILGSDAIRRAVVQAQTGGAFAFNFARSRDMAAASEWIDARLCLRRSGASLALEPYGVGCKTDFGETSAFAEYGFYRVKVSCDETAYERYMFQESRYVAMQRYARWLLDNRPQGMTRANARAWADWCINACRAYTAARWATNITSGYIRVGPATERATAALLAEVPKASGTPDRTWNNHHLLSIVGPRDLNDTSLKRRGAVPPPVPTNFGALDPLLRVIPPRPVELERAFRQDFPGPVVKLGTGGTPAVQVAWPVLFDDSASGGRVVTNAAYSSDIRTAVSGWFSRTIERDLFVRQDVVYVWPKAGPQVIDTGPNRKRGSFWFGGAKATIQLCEAYLEDIATLPFGAVVRDGLDAFIERLGGLPPEVLSMSIPDMNATVGRVVDDMRNAVGAAFGAVTAVLSAIPVVGQIAGLIVAVLGVIVSFLLQYAGAFGGAKIAAKMLVSPVVRMIQDPGNTACDLDVRVTEEGPALAASLPRLLEVRNAAAQLLPVREWYEAAKRADAPPNFLDVLENVERKPPFPWLGLGVASVVLVGGYTLLRR